MSPERLAIGKPIWLSTATTARLGAVWLWMDWQQNVRLLFRQRKNQAPLLQATYHTD